MSKNNPQWSGYIVLGDTVNIYNSDKVIEDKRKIFPNIDEILVLENRISFLKDSYSQNEGVDLVGLNSKANPMFVPVSGIFVCMLNMGLNIYFNNPMVVVLNALLGCSCTNIALDIHKSKVIANNSRAIGRFYDAEIEKHTHSINRLLCDPIDDSKIVRNELIQVSKDKDYSYELLGRESIFGHYGKMKGKIKRAIRKDIIDEYIDSLGCRDDDKKVLKELITKDFMTPKNSNKQLVRK